MLQQVREYLLSTVGFVVVLLQGTGSGTSGTTTKEGSSMRAVNYQPSIFEMFSKRSR
jgi:hypothetical protein